MRLYMTSTHYVMAEDGEGTDDRAFTDQRKAISFGIQQCREATENEQSVSVTVTAYDILPLPRKELARRMLEGRGYAAGLSDVWERDNFDEVP